MVMDIGYMVLWWYYGMVWLVWMMEEDYKKHYLQYIK